MTDIALCAAFAVVMALVAVRDTRTKTIPLKYTAALAAIGIIRVTAAAVTSLPPLSPVLSALGGFALGGGLLLATALISGGGMGGGDIKLFAAAGIFFGVRDTLILLVLSVFFASVPAALLLVTKKRSRKDSIPFGPFVFIASVVVMTAGDRIFKLFQSAFGLDSF